MWHFQLFQSLLQRWCCLDCCWGNGRKKAELFLACWRESKTLLPRAESQIPLKILCGTWAALVTPAAAELVFLIHAHQEDVRVCRSSMSPWAWGRVSWIVMEQQEWQGAWWEIHGIGEARQRKWNNCPGDFWDVVFFNFCDSGTAYRGRGEFEARGILASEIKPRKNSGVSNLIFNYL